MKHIRHGAVLWMSTGMNAFFDVAEERLLESWGCLKADKAAHPEDAALVDLSRKIEYNGSARCGR